MNLDDESFLSAYLDDELDPSDRASVEWAIESDPQIRRRFQSLCRTRDVMSGLTRPSLPIDIRSAVLSRLPSEPARPRTTRFYRAGLWVATAASVLFVVLWSQTANLGRNGRQAPAKNPIAVASHVIPATPTASGSPSGTRALIHTPDALTPSPKVEKSPAELVTAPSIPAKDLTEPGEERERLLALLDRPGLKRVVIPIDFIGEGSLDQVNSIIQDSPRKDAEFARFSLTQGLVIDPSLPNGAELFVLVVDDKEREHLLASLAREFPDVSEEDVTAPEIHALLAEVGRVRMLPGSPAAGLIDPPPSIVAFAKKSEPSLPNIFGPPSKPSPREIARLESPSQRPLAAKGSESLPGSRQVPELISRPKAPGDKTTLLVWVTRRGTADRFR
jgi:hypothetical protein